MAVRLLKKMSWSILAIVSAVLIPLPTSAQNSSNNHGLNVEISPLPIELSTKPGTSASADLRIRNTGSAPETLKISLKTFTAEGTDGHVVLHDPTPADSYINWVSFSKTQFDAPPGQWQTIKMTVNLPKTAAFGYYYAVQFQLANPPKPQPGSTALQGAVAIFVLLNAETPGAHGKISVASFKADHSTYEFLPVNFSIAVRNTGNVHTAPHGNIFIKKGSRQVAAIAVNSTEGMVLPSSNRIFTASWADGFPVYTQQTDGGGQPKKDKNGQVKTYLKWDFSKTARLRFGHYTANLVLIYSDGQRDIPITGTLSFWVIPWRLLAIIAFILLLIIGLILYVIILRRRLNGSGKVYKGPPR